MSINISYFHPELPGDKKPKKADKGLMSPNQVMEGAQKKAQAMNNSKSNTGLLQKEGDSRLLTNDGREIFNENK